MNLIILTTIFDFIDEKLIQFFGRGIIYHAVETILILLAAVLVGKLLKIFLKQIAKLVSRKTAATFHNKILETILSHDVTISVIIGAYISLQSIAESLPKKSIFYRTIDLSDKILLSILTIVIATAIVRGVNLLTRESLISTAQRNNTTYDRAQTLLIKRVITFIASLITIIIILNVFGQNITSLLAILGIGSLAIGLAAQDTITNIIAGYTIMIDRPFRIGDRIKLQSGEEGDVYEIGVRSTKILDFDNNLIVIPNTELVRTRLINYSAPREETRVVVDFTLDYSTDAQKAKEILLQILKNEKDFITKPEPEVYLLKLTELGLQFRITGRVASVKTQAKVANRLRYEVHQKIISNGMKFAVAPIQ